MDYQSARENMVDCQVRTCDVTNHELLSAMLSVPREAFVPEDKIQLAYIDEDISLSKLGVDGRYLMQAASFARLAQVAEVDENDIVLVVGAGTGYSSAVLSLLSSSVVAIESDDALVEFSSRKLSENGFSNVAVLKSDMTQGFQKEAPYDVIFIDGAIEVLPQTLLEQLAEGGRLVCVMGTGNAAVAKLYCLEDGIISQREIMNCAIHPLPGFEQAHEFSF